MREEELNFIKDVFEIAKYLNWDSEVGKERAQNTINEIHKGKYGSNEGIWVQYANLIADMEKRK